MPSSPKITPLPLPIFMPQVSSAVEEPTPSQAPLSPGGPKLKEEKSDPEQSEPESQFILPRLRFEIRDLSHAGSKAFLSSVDASTVVEASVRNVLRLLYLTPSCPFTHIPGTRSVTLILQSMPGVAYTTGVELDDDHKEIHFSLEYIEGISASRKADEIRGVIVHEMVHCYQYNGKGACPGGLVEGIADWVRLNCQLEPPHWKREPEAAGRWDAGYQHTGYFLDYLETRYGNGTISKMNEKLRIYRYEEKSFWTELLGRPVSQLWSDYKAAVSNNLGLSENLSSTTNDDEGEIVVVDRDDIHSSEEANARISS